MNLSSRPAPRAFDRVDTWVFDLDNTLYPHHLNLWQQVDERIRDYIADFLKVTREEAFKVQKDYYKRYGTSMRGLMTEHGMKPDDFLDFVHQIDHSPLTPNAALGSAIEVLPGRKLILTNGTRRHADAVLARLELDRHFDGVFDNFIASAHHRMLRRSPEGPKRGHPLGHASTKIRFSCYEFLEIHFELPGSAPSEM